MSLLKEKENSSGPSEKDKFYVNFDDDSGAVVGTFDGDVSVDDIIGFWTELIKNDSLPSETNGVIMDFSEAVLDFEASAYSRIVDFFLENISFVKRFKIGVVANNPHNIVVVMLIARENYMYEMRPFTTVKASHVWIMS